MQISYKVSYSYGVINQLPNMTESVKVMVRCRPINRRQKQLNCEIVVKVDSKQNQINLFKLETKDDPKSFTFDNVFDMDSLQSTIYEQTAFSLVDSVIEGYNGTIFAYGQTGCGKTHTMMGSNQSQSSKGIIPRTFNQIITVTNSQSDKKHLVRCSFIEIYNEEIHDLLGKNIKERKQLKESPDRGVFVKDLTSNIVKTTAEMEHFMDIGFRNRATRETAMNKQSSRSHSLFTIYIQSQEIDMVGKQKFKAGKLNLVDLAGSQRQSKTHATGDGMKQAAKINLSLSALGNVISALVDGKTNHIPYRDSKLTRLLQDSLGGNTKTIMIAAVSPASDNYEQTLSTLRYASRAKFIKNKPIVNEDPKDTLLKQYAQEIKNLKMMLEGKMPMNPGQSYTPALSDSSEVQFKYIEVNKADENLQNELLSKEEKLKVEQEEKQRLKLQLENLQKLISHDKVQSESEKKELERLKKLKQKVKAQKKKQQQWQSQKRKKDQQLMSVQKKYNSLTDEVESMRVKFNELKKKYLTSLQQINDARQQAQRQKQQLLNTIRFQQSQINKYTGICSMLLNSTQIDQIISQSEYHQDTLEWLIAPFVYKDRNINFPKLGSLKNTEYIEHQKDKRELIFKQSALRKQDTSKQRASYRISQVVRVAREHNDVDLSGSHNALNFPAGKKLKTVPMNKNMQTLTPLKIDSETKLRLDEDAVGVGTHNNHSSKQIKLNPILAGGGSKKEINKIESQWGWGWN